MYVVVFLFKNGLLFFGWASWLGLVVWGHGFLGFSVWGSCWVGFFRGLE